ncbi:alpha/beta fold hydrolase [Aquicoccus sp. SCR17]|nr:alpha/beta fold hydrolase [Carideicomes alvinocaridis]
MQERITLTGRALTVLLVLSLTACTRVGTFGFTEPVEGLDVQRIFVATQRQPVEGTDLYGVARAGGLNYAQIDVSIPPNHQVGQIEWQPKYEAANPMESFAVVGAGTYEGRRDFARAMRREPGQSRLVYVHGYNYTMAESVYRLAQLREDFEPDMPSVLFSWASSGDPIAYVHDRDSVLIARNELERLLMDLTAYPGDEVTLLAHSMGAYLVMETLRQAALRGNDQILDRISGVFLIQPDLDPTLFRFQVNDIGELPQPFVIFTAEQDRVLRLASLIFREERLGRIRGPEAVDGLPVRVVSVSDLAEDSGLNHAVPFTSPLAIEALGNFMRSEGSRSTPQNRTIFTRLGLNQVLGLQ